MTEKYKQKKNNNNKKQKKNKFKTFNIMLQKYNKKNCGIYYLLHPFLLLAIKTNKQQ